MSDCSSVLLHLAKGRNLHFFEAGSRWSLQPDACSNTNTWESVKLFDQSDQDKRFVQFEYNSSPIGPYVEPYDQSDCITLKAQLSNSTLNFDLKDLEKIDPLKQSENIRKKDTNDVALKVLHNSLLLQRLLRQ